MRTFCCCIPVRLGVLLLSPVTTAGAALLSYVQLFSLINYAAQLSTFEKAIRGALVGITILIALASVFGFIGAIFASRRAVAFYSNMLWIGLLTFTVLGAIDIWQYFQNKSSFVTSCENDSKLNDSDLKSLFGSNYVGTRNQACQKLADSSAIVVAILFGILVLVLMWLIGIVTKYKHQLESKHTHVRSGGNDGWGYSTPRNQRRRIFGNLGRSHNSNKSGYVPTQTREVGDHAPLTQSSAPPAGWKEASYESNPYSTSDSDPYRGHNRA